MFEPSHYELLDFGAGRKLERFGTEILDRPSPAAERADVVKPGLWSEASTRFEPGRGGTGEWLRGKNIGSSVAAKPWIVGHGRTRLLVRLKASGNVGLFPEQAKNWDWIANQVARSVATMPTARRPRVLNLFGYTGGASLAAAEAGAAVTHVDSSAPTVAWAKDNAAASEMAELPIRWLVEDAMKFVAREARRGNFYDGVIADPPTYGHGPKGRPFKFDQHLDELLTACGQLLGTPGDSHRFLLFSCHVPGFGLDDALAAVSRARPAGEDAQMASWPLALETADGRSLSAGVSAYWGAPTKDQKRHQPRRSR